MKEFEAAALLIMENEFVAVIANLTHGTARRASREVPVVQYNFLRFARTIDVNYIVKKCGFYIHLARL